MNLVSRAGFVVAGALSLVACGGGGGTGGDPTGPSGPVLSVGGDYSMAVELTENACGAVTVLPLPTRVAHAPGGLQFQLTHGPATYEGTLEAGGGFRTAARVFADATSSQTVHIEGRFIPTGLEAVVTVDQAAPVPACRYRVRWTGTKQGAANVIP